MLSTPAEYYLMHKDIPVCLMEISSEGSIRNIRRNTAEYDHFPLGGQMNNVRFHEWWKDRAIPQTRHGAETALYKLGYSTTASALVNNLALSLTDCYWICPRGSDLRWSEVNLFTNDFVDTFGEITINQDLDVDLRNATRFNCATSQGELQKKWCIDQDSRRYIVKGNYGSSYQQSLNEVFASDLHRNQGFKNYTPYTTVHLTVDGDMDGLGCMAYNFCSEKIEYISAWELLQTIKVRNNESYYHPLRSVCTELGISAEEFDAFFDYQIMTDYLITNTDRHMNNIGILRDPDSLKILGMAPIYDSGNSMFYNIPFDRLSTMRMDQIKTHSFIASEVKLLQYVHSRDAVDLSRAAMDFSLYEQDVSERHIRIPVVKELYERKLERLSVFQRGADIWKQHRTAF